MFAQIGNGLTLAGLDLDVCKDADGALTDWAEEIVEHVPTDTETSPSARGVKLLFHDRDGRFATNRGATRRQA